MSYLAESVCQEPIEIAIVPFAGAVVQAEAILIAMAETKWLHCS